MGTGDDRDDRGPNRPAHSQRVGRATDGSGRLPDRNGLQAGRRRRQERGRTSVDVIVRRGDAIVCTITNEAKAQAPNVSPVLECVLFNNGSPDVAYWGYNNRVARPSRSRWGTPTASRPRRPIGTSRTSSSRGGIGGVQHAVRDGRRWARVDLSGGSAAASASSPACNPTVELRKVTAPADDPGVFQLRIDRRIVATGPNGTTSGPVRTGIGEGTASETAAPGTNLADYDSSVECTRNGTIAASVPGTKVDGEVTRGDVVVCTFTNTRKGAPPTPPPRHRHPRHRHPRHPRHRHPRHRHRHRRHRHRRHRHRHRLARCRCSTSW